MPVLRDNIYHGNAGNGKGIQMQDVRFGTRECKDSMHKVVTKCTTHMQKSAEEV